MSVAFPAAVKDAMVERCDPHCIAWARATASLWGMSDDHDLDEPVQLSDEVPVRVRWAASNGRSFEPSILVIPDRDLVLKARRTGHHVAVRYAIKGMTFVEIEVRPPALRKGDTASVKRFL